jgi:adenylate kinase
MNLVLLGAPGAGKGTHAQRLSKETGWPHISTGDILRENLKQGTSLGNKAKEYMDSGQLVPDDLIIDLMEERLSQEDCQAGIILDGFPRTTEQAEALDQLMTKLGKKIEQALLLQVPLEVVVRRMTGRLVCKNCGAVYHKENLKPKVAGVCDRCGSAELVTRSDDQEDTVRKRYKVYEKQTAPLINYYAAQDKLIEIDGAQGSAEDIYKAIKAKLKIS